MTMIDYIFLEEAKKQCKFALIAVENIKCGLEKYDTDLFWFSVHGFLSATGNLSKLLKRAKPLATILEINDDHIIFDRAFRNHWEHFDERIERWAINSKNKVFVDCNIGPASQFEVFADAIPFRNYEVDTGCLVFAGDRMEVQKLIDAIYQVKVKLDRIKLN